MAIARSRYRTVGIGLGLAGLALAVAALVASLVAGERADDPAEAGNVAEILAWSLGINTTTFAVIKIGITTVLLGILIRWWMRIDAVKASVPSLAPDTGPAADPKLGHIDTRFGPARNTASPPKPLLIHRMAETMRAPMLVWGRWRWPPDWSSPTSGPATSAPARGGPQQPGPRVCSSWGRRFSWPGSHSCWAALFIGFAAVFAAISFAIARILGEFRQGGGEVQEAIDGWAGVISGG